MESIANKRAYDCVAQWTKSGTRYIPRVSVTINGVRTMVELAGYKDGFETIQAAFACARNFLYN